MEYKHIDQMINGWFIGNFSPSVFNTEEFEVAFMSFKKEQPTEDHYHKIATEYNLVVKGKVKINHRIFSKGDIFILKPYEWSKSEFMEDTDIVVVKIPSVKDDKYTS